MGGRRRLGQPPVGWWFKRVGVHSRQIRSDDLKRDDESLRDEVTDTMLPRKVPKLQAKGIRTLNRHRWARRVS